jgi:hypothetical protein
MSLSPNQEFTCNILATNYFLQKIKIIDDANCNFCQKENETIEHIFGGCENVQNLLGQVNSWFGDKDIKTSKNIL